MERYRQSMSDEIQHPEAEPAEATPERATADPFLSLKRGGTEIYLIRHADALPGAEEVADGGYDEQALSEVGRRQAEALGARMRGVPVAAVYSSPIGRARETAAAVATGHGLEVRIEHELREVELGPIGPDLNSGISQAELSKMLRQRLGEIAAIAVTTGSWSSIPGSEPSARLRARVTAAIDGLARRHPGERIAVVSHAGAINAYIAAMLGLTNDYFFPAANTSVSIVRVKSARFMLLALNDVHHLLAAGLLKVME